MSDFSHAELLGIDLDKLYEERFTTRRHLELMAAHRARREAWEHLQANPPKRTDRYDFTDEQMRIALAVLEGKE